MYILTLNQGSYSFYGRGYDPVDDIFYPYLSSNNIKFRPVGLYSRVYFHRLKQKLIRKP